MRILEMRQFKNCLLVFHKQQLQNAAFCKEKFVFACLTYKMSSVFGTGRPRLKASQMSKARASSHEYSDVEKIKNLCEQN